MPVVGLFERPIVPLRWFAYLIPAGFTLALLFLLIPTAQAAPHASAVKPPQKKPVGRKGRDTQVIDGAWKFQIDPEKHGEQNGWTHTPPTTAQETVVPALWTTAAAPNYSGTAWYWRTFDIPETWKGQTIRLRFEGVAERTHVWLNGDLLGEHADGVTPFTFTATKSVRIGQTNLLAVQVEGSAKQGVGIWQGVLVMAHDEAYIEDVFAQADGVGFLSAALSFQNNSDKSGAATLDAVIVALDTPTKPARKTNQNLLLTPAHNTTTLTSSLSRKVLRTWSPSTPVLYALQLVFRQDADILDTQETEFGYREFGLKDGNILLNGEPVHLTAIAPAMDLPVVIASTNDTERAKALLSHLKDAGVNLVYLNAPPPAMLRLADETGLFVIEGARTQLLPNATANELKALVERDRNHPCILGWNLRDATDQIGAIRLLDPTRFLLTGLPTKPMFYPPGQGEGAGVVPPSGLLPAQAP